MSPSMGREGVLPAFLLVCSFALGEASLDMFVDRAEVHRITGVQGSRIYYIQEGVINQYATGYVVPVGARISSISFHWQSLVRKLMPYEISFRWNDPAAMSEPRANVSYVGYVPRVEAVFSVLFPCTGRVSAVVEVDIMLNITTYQPKQQIVFLKLKRRKTCLQGRPTRLGPPDNTTSLLELGDAARQHDFSLILGVAGAIAVTFVTLGAVMLLVIRQRKATLSPVHADSINSGSRAFAKNLSKSYHSIDKMARSCSYATIASLKKLPRLHPTVTSLPNDGSDVSRPVTSLADCAMASQHYASSEIPVPSAPTDQPPAEYPAVDRRELGLTDLLAEGGIARLYRATVGRRPCLVKTVTAQASPQQCRQLVAEGRLLAGCCHPALLPALGCTADTGPPCVLYPDLGTASLRRFLATCRLEGAAGAGPVLRQQTMVDMTVQLLSGLVHLHGRGIVHRDVAARNCAVDDRFRVRLTDSALSSDLYPAEYSRLADGACRPVRWAAPESLLRERHSPASDVWSAAVTAWEVTSLGQLPFSELKDPLEVLVLLREGYRLARPTTCPAQMYSTLLSCWNLDPERRPQSRDLLTWMQDFSRAFDRLI
ncbi:tyrosine-protein kinase Drl-like [Amphibalanus amphitrite]|uniref:tyrosine-protein kinase Drl-like n=1 Tax=Amphibalanus amphitrite TaxID=1232801 RepID=UPI001C9149FF|nr:tyrosine-protein kinase Drl-like [Amphibalanus amphitrite]